MLNDLRAFTLEVLVLLLVFSQKHGDLDSRRQAEQRAVRAELGAGGLPVAKERGCGSEKPRCVPAVPYKGSSHPEVDQGGGATARCGRRRRSSTRRWFRRSGDVQRRRGSLHVSSRCRWCARGGRTRLGRGDPARWSTSPVLERTAAAAAGVECGREPVEKKRN
uniref:Secreted protein n=1 Tax=Arundo donax TaxID=35708 RepID=A0A0A9AER1_ARUDO